MDDSQNVWQKTKRAVRFTWRHILTLYVLSVIVRAIFSGYPLKAGACAILAGAVFFDWAKQSAKPLPHDNPFVTSSIQPWRDQWGDPSIRGTPANFLSNMDSDRYN